MKIGVTETYSEYLYLPLVRDHGSRVQSSFGPQLKMRGRNGFYCFWERLLEA